MPSKIELFNEDCLPAMRKMKDKQFDLALVDPPYGVNIGSSVGGANHLARKARIGGQNLSSPKSTRGSMIVESLKKNTSRK